jgi:hypothetical protein
VINLKTAKALPEIVKVFGCRPPTKLAAHSGGRRPKTSKGGNRAGAAWGARR